MVNITINSNGRRTHLQVPFFPQNVKIQKYKNFEKKSQKKMFVFKKTCNFLTYKNFWLENSFTQFFSLWQGFIFWCNGNTILRAALRSVPQSPAGFFLMQWEHNFARGPSVCASIAGRAFFWCNGNTILRAALHSVPQSPAGFFSDAMGTQFCARPFGLCLNRRQGFFLMQWEHNFARGPSFCTSIAGRVFFWCNGNTILRPALRSVPQSPAGFFSDAMGTQFCARSFDFYLNRRKPFFFDAMETQFCAQFFSLCLNHFFLM